MKDFSTEDGLFAYEAMNGYVVIGAGYDHAELSAKEVGKLIIYLTKILMKGVVQ